MKRYKMVYRCMSDMIKGTLGRPQALAEVFGSDEYEEIRGKVFFYQTDEGVLVMAEFFGLPLSGICKGGILGFHIHEGWLCRGNEEDAFAGAKGHYNPENCKHPYHAGDLPPLFANNGHAFTIFLTDNFFVEEVIGRVIIVHADVDDFHTQPSGNAGKKIACGKIVRMC